MKFGVLQFFSWPGRRVKLETVFERALDRIQVMDRTGYDAVWLAEHHFTDYSVCPSVHLMGMHVAERTEHLRIGTAVSLAAFYHPLRLAEEVALLDVLTGGRVNWGAGRGFDVTEFRTFGVPVEQSRERFQEAVDIVVQAWTEERLTWHGKHWHFDDVEVLPKPAQRPHPPVWVAAGSDDAVQWAGERGYTVMLGPHNAFADIAARRDRYHGILAEHGHPVTGRTIPMTRFVAVADTDREAQRIARDGADWVVATYKNKQRGSENPTATVVTASGEVRELDPVERYLENVAVWGCPARVIDTLQMLRETMYLDYLMLAPLSHSSFMKFTEKVMPKLV
jgi:alkanesulfonate monooxygenase SsuD/methylene tetrahydromethanopterin reductase-like flavin-dependent oxidoreductase (luciferase family)